MNKGAYLIVQLATVLAMSGAWFRDLPSSIFSSKGNYASSTPNIPSGGGRHRFRPHAPSDGRWHMKLHRGRVR